MLYLIEIGTKTSPSRITSAVPASRVVEHVCRENLDFVVRFENAPSCMNYRHENARRHASSRQLCLLAWVVVLWSARPCFAALCSADCTLLCWVCGSCSTTICSYIWLLKAHKNNRWGEKALLLKNEKIEKRAGASNRTKRCSSGSSERPERSPWSPLRKKDKKVKSLYLYLILRVRFMICSDELLHPNYFRSDIEVERPIIIPCILVRIRKRFSK